MVPRFVLFPKEVNLHIGEFKSFDAGSRAAIVELSRGVRKYPGRKIYRVYFNVQSEAGYPIYYAGLYDREHTAVGYESDPGSGFSRVFHITGDATIHAVAKDNGTFEDFGSLETLPEAK